MNTFERTQAQAARQDVRDSGGRYTEMLRPEPVVDLAGTFGADRIEQLKAAGYAAPVAYQPRAADTDGWWVEHFAAAEYGTAGGTIPKLPDDSTPGMTGGGSLSGHRRTHRVRYRGQGAEFQMPSATAIRRFAAAGNRVFDVPVTVTRPDGVQVAGWVRVAGGGYAWTSEALGFGEGSDNAAVAEGVAAILEARRPSLGLVEAGNLLVRHRRSLSRVGVEGRTVSSGWIRSVGYDQVNQVMVMSTDSGRAYGYKMHKSVFDAVAGASSTGKAYNALVKHRREGVSVEQCAGCGRFYVTVPHVCPPGEADRREGDGFAVAARLAVG